jgi:hypothetical protein
VNSTIEYDTEAAWKSFDDIIVDEASNPTSTKLVDEAMLSRAEFNCVVDMTIVNVVTMLSQPAANYELVVQSPASIAKSGTARVTGVSSTSINASGITSTSRASDDVRVLMSIVPSKSVENQTLFIENDSLYFTMKGALKVPEVVEVTSAKTANRLYSIRETLAVLPPGIEDDPEYSAGIKSERDQYGKGVGLPAISEDDVDDARVVYEYGKPYVDSSGAVVRDPIEATNNDGQVIRLAHADGSYLVERDSWRLQNLYRFSDLLTLNVSIQTLPAAAIVVEGYDVTETNQELTKQLIGSRLYVQYVDAGSADPKLIATGDTNDLLTFLLENASEYLYVLPKHLVNGSDGALPTYPTLESMASESEDVVKTWDDFFALKTKIETNEGPFSSANNPETIDRRIRTLPFTVGVETIYVAYDPTYEFIPIKPAEKIISSIFMPFRFVGGFQTYYSTPFSYNTANQLLSPSPTYPITGVYLHARGYGGTNTNESFVNELPYDVDYKAFNERLVTNAYEDDVYLVDSTGNQIISNVGLFKAKDGDDIEIAYDSFPKNDNVVKVRRAVDSYGTPDVYHIYRAELSPISIFTPKDVLYFGSYTSINDSGTIVHSPSTTANGYWAPQESSREFVSIISVLKNGISVNVAESNTVKVDSKDVPEYAIEFTNANGKKLDFISVAGTMATGFKIVSTNKPFIEDGQYDIEKFAEALPDALLTLTITHYLGQSATRTFEVRLEQPFLDEPVYEYAKVLSMQYAQFDDADVRVSSNTSIEVEIRALQKTVSGSPPYTLDDCVYGSTVSSDDSAVQVLTPSVGSVINNQAHVTVNVSSANAEHAISFVSTGKFVQLTSEESKVNHVSERIALDVRLISDIQLVMPRYWYKPAELKDNKLSTDFHTQVGYQLVARDMTLSPDEVALNFDSELGACSITASVGLHTSTVLLEKNESAIPTLSFLNEGQDRLFYLSQVNESYEYTLKGANEELLIEGMKGSVLLREPAFETFRALQDKHGLVVQYRDDKTIATRSNTDINSIASVSSDFTTITLGSLLGSKYDDGEPHNIMLKVLPVKSVVPMIDKQNDPEYFMQVTGSDLNTYNYDRVWLNSQAIDPPPVRVGESLYDVSSSSSYHPETKIWRNNDGFRIMEANEEGKLVRATRVNDSIVRVVLGDETGSLAGDVYGSIDRRSYPREPIYKTAVDTLHSEFYVEGVDMNPFWQYVRVKDVYDTKRSEWTQETSLVKAVKSGGAYVFSNVSESEAYTSVMQGLDYSIDELTNVQVKNAETVNYEEGIFKALLGEPSSMYAKNKTILKNGILFTNSFYMIDGEQRGVWSSSANVESNVVLTCIVNSTADLASTSNKDASIIQATELGIFDESHNMIAYLSFPPIEYRTDKHHISFSLLIREAVFVATR